MKIDILRSLAAVVLSGMLTWGIVEISSNPDTRLPLGIMSGLAITVASVLLFGISDSSRSMVSARVLATIYLVVALALNVTFAFFLFNIPLYIIINGVLLMLFIIVYSAIAKASKTVG